MSWQEEAKISHPQKEELLALLNKLNWSVERYEQRINCKVDDLYWLQAMSCINGLKYLYDNPNTYKIQA